MIIIDTSILSIFTHLGISEQLERLGIEFYSTPRTLDEYYRRWEHAKIPRWLKIKFPKQESRITNRTISRVDMSIINLAIEMKMIIGTDDLAVRKIAKSKKIETIGTVGLLKALYKRGIYNEKGEYLELIKKLQKDLYLSEELRRWTEDG